MRNGISSSIAGALVRLLSLTLVPGFARAADNGPFNAAVITGYEEVPTKSSPATGSWVRCAG